MDMEEGNTFWSILPNDPCNKNHHSIIFQGSVTKILSSEYNRNETLYTIEEKEIAFTLIINLSMNVCGHTLSLTEHPKLLIYERKENSLFIENQKK